MLKIGEFSSLGHTSVKTLRFYDSVGLLRPAYVDRDSRYRYYSVEQLTQLRLILRLKAFGFSLREIRSIVHEPSDVGRLRALLLERRLELQRELREERLRLAGLDEWVEQLAAGHITTQAVTVKRIAAHTVATIRQTISSYADAIALFDELRRSFRQPAKMNDPPSAIWHSCGDSGEPVDCEVFTVVNQAVDSSRRVRLQRLPERLMASIVHNGPVEAAPGPYATARSWIAAHGYRVTGSKRELYWRGRVDQSRSSDVTEIQFPISVCPRHP
jgi:DNA-binding transcriptional MerR regulator